MQNIAKICKKLVKLHQKDVKLICTLYVVCMYFVCSLYVVCKTTYKLHMAICTLYVVLENYIKTTYKVHTNYIQSTYLFLRFFDDFFEFLHIFALICDAFGIKPGQNHPSVGKTFGEES